MIGYIADSPRAALTFYDRYAGLSFLQNCANGAKYRSSLPAFALYCADLSAVLLRKIERPLSSGLFLLHLKPD